MLVNIIENNIAFLTFYSFKKCCIIINNKNLYLCKVKNYKQQKYWNDVYTPHVTKNTLNVHES